MSQIETTRDLVLSTYKKTRKNLEAVQKKLQRPLSLAEKILYGHLIRTDEDVFKRGESILSLSPDRVCMQDATAQMALLQFMLSGKEATAVPTTVHCDHLILAYQGMEEDVQASMKENKEVFDFLQTCSSRYGIGFWKPGAGIIHQVFLENYAFPGGLVIGTDSHTPNGGGLCMLAVGVGGADASDVMAGLSWEVKNPYVVGVHLKGKLDGWASPKDVILKLCGIMTVKGGTNKIVEYFGEGCSSISCTGKATITNMGAEIGATCSVFPFDERMADYMKKTERKEFAEVALENQDILTADKEILENPKKYYDEVIEIDLSSLKPSLVGPHSPDAERPLNQMKKTAKKEGWPVRLSAALIGSCTNSSYEDMTRAASVAEQAIEKGIKMPQQFMVSPGSSQIKKTMERDGIVETFEKIGAVVLANACGPCIGQWKREDFKKGEVNTIINSFNRNFRGRNDANPETLSFIASPEVTLAVGLSGRVDFDPETDSLKTKDGKEFKLKPPKGREFPEQGFAFGKDAYVEPEGKSVMVKVSPSSERIQILKPFSSWDGKDIRSAVVLCKAFEKCTTDHISPAGAWLRYRGHLDNISDNLLVGATNAFSKEIGKGVNVLTGKTEEFSKVARDYKSKNQPWVIIGGENYGEGSSREHAAMTPRYLGAKAVIVKSFARIHLTNLKKQGVLALTFVDPNDYEKVQQNDRIDIVDLKDFAPEKNLKMFLNHEDGSQDQVELTHSFTKDQIAWFREGSALNAMKKLSSK